MMKKYLFGLLALGILQHASAQAPKAPSRWSIDLTAGPAVPVGKFEGYHNEYADHGVSTGGGIELAGEYRICHHFSAILAFSGQLNSGNGVPYMFSSTYVANGEGAPLAIHKNWKLARIMTGGVYTVPLTKKAGPELMFRGLAGIQQTHVPDFGLYPPGATINGVPEKDDVPGLNMPWGFSYEGDIGIKWNFPGRIALLAYAGYNGSSSSKREAGYVIIGPINYIPGPMTQPQRRTIQTGSLVFRAGISCRL